MKYLLDTNVLSDARRQIHPGLNAWLSTQPRADLAISVVALLELERGVLRLERRDPAAGAHLREMAVARRDGAAADERWHVRKDGFRFFASGVMTPIRGGGFAKVCRDATARRQADEALRARLPGHGLAPADLAALPAVA